MQQVSTEALSKFLNTIVKKKYPQVSEIVVTEDEPMWNPLTSSNMYVNNVYIIFDKPYIDSSDEEIIDFVRESSKILLYKSGRRISIVSFANRY